MTTTEKMVAGRPVIGEIEKVSRDSVEQWPIDGFVEYLDSILNLPGVEAVKWHQFTPYFNDGDPCVFHPGEIYASLGSKTGGDYEDGFLDSYDLKNNYDREDVTAAMDAMSYQTMKHYYHAMEEAFGDPADVVATLTGFAVEYYDHE